MASDEAGAARDDGSQSSSRQSMTVSAGIGPLARRPTTESSSDGLMPVAGRFHVRSSAARTWPSGGLAR
jgi:hypothetical protein